MCVADRHNCIFWMARVRNICLKFWFKGIQTNISVTKITAQNVPCFTCSNEIRSLEGHRIGKWILKIYISSHLFRSSLFQNQPLLVEHCHRYMCSHWLFCRVGLNPNIRANRLREVSRVEVVLLYMERWW
jgi:hypothetical protein